MIVVSVLQTFLYTFVKLTAGVIFCLGLVGLPVLAAYYLAGGNMSIAFLLSCIFILIIGACFLTFIEFKWKYREDRNKR